MKIMCVLLPHFPLQCHVLETPVLKGHPVLLTQNIGSQSIVLDYSPELGGVHSGMTLQQAISFCEKVEIVSANLQFYRDTFYEILDILEKKSRQAIEFLRHARRCRMHQGLYLYVSHLACIERRL